MPRKSRIISSTGIYHITLRSINQHIIFEEDSDYQKFLFLLSECKAMFDTDIYAYCLMNNHIHLLLHSSKENLSSFFQSLESRFVRWYNNKYSRSGHLFQGRFFSVAVENDSQYLATLVYIHNNPVKASMCRFPSEYHWSSFNAFYKKADGIINLQYSYKIAGSKELLLQYFSSRLSSSEEPALSSVPAPTRHFVPDEYALSVFRSATHLSSASDAGNLAKPVRNKYIRLLSQKGLTQKQISRFMDVSISTVKRIIKMNS